MKNNKILSLGTMYLDINCIHFPFEKGLFSHKETVGNEYQVALGGSALNFAKSASQLDLQVSFLGKTGNDPIGKILLSLIEQNNITPFVITDNKAQTNLAIHYIHQDGTSIMSSCGNANQSLTIFEIEKQLGLLLDSMNFLYLGGVFKLKNILPYLPKLAKKAKTKNVTIILDHGRINNTVSPKDRQCVYDLLPYVDIYLPSSDEFLQLFNGKTLTECFIKIKKLTKLMTVVKQSEKGATGYINGKILSIKAFSVKPINTVGAGDSFNAGFIKAYTRELSLEDCIRFGCATAALKISTDEVMTQDNIENFMRANYD